MDIQVIHNPKWICDLFMCDMIKPSFIPPPDIRQLRDLMRYRMKLTNMLTGEKNRASNCLTVSNLKLDDVESYRWAPRRGPDVRGNLLRPVGLALLLSI